MKLKEKKTLGYALFSILMIVLLSMYLGKADYEKINEANKRGLHDAKNNSVKIAKKLKAYIYDIIDETPNFTEKVKVSDHKKDKNNIKIVIVKKTSVNDKKSIIKTQKKDITIKKQNLKQGINL